MNSICKQLKNIQITGNIVPIQWCSQILRKSGKPDPIAVMILADILFWYRPTEIRDEDTGQISHYRQKFKGDMLQKKYQQYADLFGFSKRQVKDAIDNLVRLELIRREFRDIKMKNGDTLRNVMFVEPVIKNVLRITGINFEGEKNFEKNFDEKISSFEIVDENSFFPVFEKDSSNISNNNDGGCYEKTEYPPVPVFKKDSSNISSDNKKGVTKKRNTYYKKTEHVSRKNGGIHKSLQRYHPPPREKISEEVEEDISFFDISKEKLDALIDIIPVKVSKNQRKWIERQIHKYGQTQDEGIEYVRNKILYVNTTIKDKRKYFILMDKVMDNPIVGLAEEKPAPVRKFSEQALAENIRIEPGMILESKDLKAVITRCTDENGQCIVHMELDQNGIKTKTSSFLSNILESLNSGKATLKPCPENN